MFQNIISHFKCYPRLSKSLVIISSWSIISCIVQWWIKRFRQTDRWTIITRNKSKFDVVYFPKKKKRNSTWFIIELKPRKGDLKLRRREPRPGRQTLPLVLYGRRSRGSQSRSALSFSVHHALRASNDDRMMPSLQHLVNFSDSFPLRVFSLNWITWIKWRHFFGRALDNDGKLRFLHVREKKAEKDCSILTNKNDDTCTLSFISIFI